MNKPIGALAVVLLIGHGVPALAASHSHGPSHGGHHSGHGHSTHSHPSGTHAAGSGASSTSHHTTNHSTSTTHSSSSTHHVTTSPSGLLPPCKAEDATAKDAKDKTERNCRDQV